MTIINVAYVRSGHFSAAPWPLATSVVHNDDGVMAGIYDDAGTTHPDRRLPLISTKTALMAFTYV